MFEKFYSKFKVSSSKTSTVVATVKIPIKYSQLLQAMGGKSFENGLYNIYTYEDSVKWTKLLSKYYNKSEDSIIAFGHDWMGRQFCIPVNSSECVYMFDPATQEEFYIEENLLDFHQYSLCDFQTENLSIDLFLEVLKFLQINKIEYNQCLGFKIPLFFNGREELSNYCLYDLEVYWDLEYQLFDQAKNSSNNIEIKNITVNPFGKL